MTQAQFPSRPLLLYVGGPLDGCWSPTPENVPEVEVRTNEREVLPVPPPATSATPAIWTVYQTTRYLRERIVIGATPHDIMIHESLTPSEAIGRLLDGYKTIDPS